MLLAAIPLLLIPYDSLTHLLGFDPGETSQTLPATAVFSLVYLVLREGQLRVTAVGRRVMQLLFFAFACIAIVTLLNVIGEGLHLLDGNIYLRTYAGSRQALSLALGFTSFLMFQDVLARLGLRSACRWIVVGVLPSLVLCGVQILQGNYRIQGFSSEPSQLGDMLVLAFLPASAYAGLRLRNRVAVMMPGSVALFASFSGTAIMKAVFAVFSLFAVRGNIVRGLVVASIALTVTSGILMLYPDNYLFQLFGLFQSFLDSGTLIGGSFIDRFFGFVGPLHLLDQPKGWLGVGLGGDTVYFDSMFDPATAEAIRSQKTGLASISSHQGKMLLYGGLLGITLYLSAWWAAWRGLPSRHPARFMIPTVFAASIFSLGPLFLPYIWLWLAFGATARRETESPVASRGDADATTTLSPTTAAVPRGPFP